MWPKVSVPLIRKQFLFIQENASKNFCKIYPLNILIYFSLYVFSLHHNVFIYLYVGLVARKPVTSVSRVGISGTTAKSRQRKFVPSSHPGPFAVVATSWKSQTKVGTRACFDL